MNHIKQPYKDNLHGVAVRLQEVACLYHQSVCSKENVLVCCALAQISGKGSGGYKLTSNPDHVLIKLIRSHQLLLLYFHTVQFYGIFWR